MVMTVVFFPNFGHTGRHFLSACIVCPDDSRNLPPAPQLLFLHVGCQNVCICRQDATLFHNQGLLFTGEVLEFRFVQCLKSRQLHDRGWVSPPPPPEQLLSAAQETDSDTRWLSMLVAVSVTAGHEEERNRI